MAYNITDACVKCGSCAEQCPVEAISEGEDKYVINPDVCVSCGSCADQCPAEAIEEGCFSGIMIGLRLSRRPIFLREEAKWKHFITALPWKFPKALFL